MPIAADHSQQPLILIIDDDDDFRRTAAHIFQQMGFATVSAEDSKSALRQMEEEIPALILLDIYMPGMDGLALLSAIRNAAIHVPVVITSGALPKSGDDPLTSAAVNLGADAVICKPFSLDELRDLIRVMVPALAAAAAECVASEQSSA